MGGILADVAEEQGTSTDELVEVLVQAAEGRVAERVAAGDLAREEADAKSAELIERVTTAVERGA